MTDKEEIFENDDSMDYEMINDCNCDKESCFICEGKWQDAADLDNFGTE